MAVNKVVINKDDGTSETLIDLSGDTLESAYLLRGVTAHDKHGYEISGEVDQLIDNIDDTVTNRIKKLSTGFYVYVIMKEKNGGYGSCGWISGYEGNYSVRGKIDETTLGDATAEDVLSGKTFTSSSGLKVEGTAPAKSVILVGSDPVSSISPDDCDIYLKV